MSTTLHMLKEVSPYMMSFVIVTEKDNCIVIDGGRPQDMPKLKEYLKGRHISAWILTHAHDDHISGIISELEKNGCADFDIGKLCYNFPDYDTWMKAENVPDREYLERELNNSLPAFNAVIGRVADKVHIVQQGERMQIDEVTVDFIYTSHEGLYSNPMNDSSTVFKLTTPSKTVLFLGDLGPDAGDILFDESRHLLKSDIVQMAHHGHMNVSMEVYAAIAPEACMWCAPLWLYNEPEVPGYLADREKLRRMGRIRMHGQAVTRRWMEQLGVKQHYVSGEGDHEIQL